MRRSLSRNARCRRSHSLPVLHTWIALPRVSRRSPAQELVLDLGRIDAVPISGATRDRRSAPRHQGRTESWMSMIGFAASPGTEVEPTWSTRTASRRARPGSAQPRARTSPAMRGRSRPARTRGAPAYPRAAREPRHRRSARARRRRLLRGVPRRCPPDATGRRASIPSWYGSSAPRSIASTSPSSLQPVARARPRSGRRLDDGGRSTRARRPRRSPGAGCRARASRRSWRSCRRRGTPCSRIPGMPGRC